MMEQETALERWLEVKPYMPAQLARRCGVPLHTMLRAIRGAAPLEDQAALALAGLLGVPFEELFEVRGYRWRRQECTGWFARAARPRDEQEPPGARRAHDGAARSRVSAVAS